VLRRELSAARSELLITRWLLAEARLACAQLIESLEGGRRN
jgi:hypothetical protein